VDAAAGEAPDLLATTARCGHCKLTPVQDFIHDLERILPDFQTKILKKK
jgi:hypothetical protein